MMPLNGLIRLSTHVNPVSCIAQMILPTKGRAASQWAKLQLALLCCISQSNWSLVLDGLLHAQFRITWYLTVKWSGVRGWSPFDIKMFGHCSMWLNRRVMDIKDSNQTPVDLVYC
jgi:hypothetical protein